MDVNALDWLLVLLRTKSEIKRLALKVGKKPYKSSFAESND